MRGLDVNKTETNGTSKTNKWVKDCFVKPLRIFFFFIFLITHVAVHVGVFASIHYASPPRGYVPSTNWF